MNQFSKFLRDLRIKRGLMQKDAAHLLGYESSYLSALERGSRGLPKQEFFTRLVRTLELDEAEQVALNEVLLQSRRQMPIPETTSRDEQVLLTKLQAKLGCLQPLQIQIITLVLSMPAACAHTTEEFS